MSTKPFNAKISDRIIDHIQTQMAEGILNAGDKLPSERKLAAVFNASRASIREAIGLMEAKGMVKIRHGASTIILDIFTPKLIDPLQDLVKTNQSLALNVIAVRHLLEVEATILAAQHADNDALKLIENALIHLLNCDRKNTEIQVKADMDFHLAIADASQNIVLAKMLRSMGNLVEHEMLKTVSVAMQKPEAQAKLNIQHQQIYQAIKNGNSQQAERAARTHLEFVQNQLS